METWWNLSMIHLGFFLSMMHLAIETLKWCLIYDAFLRTISNRIPQFIAFPQDSAAPFWCGKWPFWPPFSVMSTPALRQQATSQAFSSVHHLNIFESSPKKDRTIYIYIYTYHFCNFSRTSCSGWWLTYPSEKSESQLGWLFPIYGEKNVPNHQPGIYLNHLQVLLDGDAWGKVGWAVGRHIPRRIESTEIWKRRFFQRRATHHNILPNFTHGVQDGQTHRLRDGQLVKELQPAKAPSPIWVTDSGMVKLVKELQPAKAPSPIWVTDSGMVKLVKELQPEKALSPISVTDSGMVKLVKELQPAKAPSPTSVTDSGMVKLVKELQPAKARSSISVTDSGMVKLVEELQP